MTLIRGWAMQGLSEDQIAHNMGIRRSTLSEWKNRFPDILDAIKKSKEVADFEVENALFKSATGFYYEETVPVTKRVNGVGEEIHIQTVKRYYKPNTTAQAIWLNNRQPKRYRRNPDPSQANQKELEEALIAKVKEFLE